MATFSRYSALGFMIGIGVRSFFVFPAILAGMAVVLGLIFAAMIFVEHSVFNRGRVWISVAAVVLGMGLGMLRYEAAVAPMPSAFGGQIGQFVALEGMVAEEPERKDRYQRVTLEVGGGDGERVLIYAPRYPELKYGDIVEARGKLSEPENFKDSVAGQIFDWRAYLAKDGIHYEIKNAAISVVGIGGNAVKHALFAIARDFEGRINLLIPEPEAAFLNGLILGDKSGLPANILEDFRLAGVTHLVALSGYNISVVANGVASILSRLPITSFIGGGAGLVAVLLFIIMTGASTTALRAGLMAALLVFARGTGRIYAANNALLAAAFLMVLWNPLILKDDISFQLSFLATWGIINIAPRFSRRLDFMPWVLREALATTLAAQIIVTPLLLHAMGYLSFVSVPANLMILPFMPFTMGGGFAVYLLSFAPLLALPAAWATGLLLRYEIFVTHFLGRLSFAGAMIIDFSGALVILSYAAIFYWHWYWVKNYEKPNNPVA